MINKRLKNNYLAKLRPKFREGLEFRCSIFWSTHRPCQRSVQRSVKGIWLINIIQNRFKVPKACQFFKLVCQRAKKRASFPTSPCKRHANFSTIFPKKFFQYLNFLIMLTICKISLTKCKINCVVVELLKLLSKISKLLF